jgi:hypothetical protein
MEGLYWLAGTGIGLTAFFLYLRHVMLAREKLSYENQKLEDETKYQSKFIKLVATPISDDATIDKLRKGDF